jgi:dTDP-4-amino-4,6-dideoxygalactose transaminase
MRAIFTTNLFGQASELGRREWHAGEGPHRTYLIEDNSQSPFAMTSNGRYAGTNGSIGVFSLNVHKHMQCGEGGMVVTDDDELARKLRAFINHGEHSGGAIGLNLRMPELCAAVALAQLRRGKEMVHDRVYQAQEIISAIGHIPGLRMPIVREGCTHVYYVIPFLIDLRAGTANSDINAFAHLRKERAAFCGILQNLGVPITVGYQEPLYRLPAFKAFARSCPVAEDLQDNRLFYFENCAWSPSKEQIQGIGEAFREAARKVLL